jgi:hypothetical protein
MSLVTRRDALGVTTGMLAAVSLSQGWMRPAFGMSLVDVNADLVSEGLNYNVSLDGRVQGNMSHIAAIAQERAPNSNELRDASLSLRLYSAHLHSLGIDLVASGLSSLLNPTYADFSANPGIDVAFAAFQEKNNAIQRDPIAAAFRFETTQLLEGKGLLLVEGYIAQFERMADRLGQLSRISAMASSVHKNAFALAELVAQEKRDRAWSARSFVPVAVSVARLFARFAFHPVLRQSRRLFEGHLSAKGFLINSRSNPRIVSRWSARGKYSSLYPRFCFLRTFNWRRSLSPA